MTERVCSDPITPDLVRLVQINVSSRYEMQPFAHSGIKSTVTAVILALSAIAATPPKEKPEATVISISDIDRESVRVRTPKDESGAQLSFLFRDKDAQQARRTFFTSRARRVRITDGATVITETKLSGILHYKAERKIRGGLILSFDTVEEANKVATALRPFLK